MDSWLSLPTSTTASHCSAAQSVRVWFSRLVGQALQVVRDRFLVLSLILLLSFFASLVLMPLDLSIHARWVAARTPTLRHITQVFRRWGDFRDTVSFCLVLWALGRWRERVNWRRAAATAFWAACLCGITANLLRFSLGRERPHDEIAQTHPYSWHGPGIAWKTNSFPSGHSATSTACGVTLALAAPSVGWVALASAILVCWSSVAHGSHFLSDVVAGAGLGLWFGIGFGFAHRRLFWRQSGESV